jgi:hypothetical protein
MALSLLLSGVVRMDELFFWLGWFGRLLKNYVASASLPKNRNSKSRSEPDQRL